MGFLKNFKDLSKANKRFLSWGFVVVLVIALPLFVSSVVNLTYDLRERAQVIPSTCVPEGNTINVIPEGGPETCHDLQAAIDAVTGPNFTINLAPGTYDIPETGDVFSINIVNKENLTITGSPSQGSRAVVLNFEDNRGGIYVSNSSGSITWMQLQGGVVNGMVRIINQSHDFALGYLHVTSDNAHAIDISQATRISIYNSEVSSSAGAIEVQTTNGFSLTNSKITNSDNGLAIDASNVNIVGNLFAYNRERALRLISLNIAHIDHNTIIYNGSNSRNIPSVEYAGSGNSSVFFSQNIIAYGEGPGLLYNSYQNFTHFAYNNIYGTGTSTHPNYVGMPDQTGFEGNISQNPLINTNPASGYCLYSNSPSLYGDVSKLEYMGYTGSCGVPAPTSSPTPTQTPMPTDTPQTTQEPTSSPIIGGPPNSCGGTCGSNYNCGDGLFCYQGFCRNPSCPNSSTCGCASPAAQVTPAPTVIPVPTIEEVAYLDTSTPRITARPRISSTSQAYFPLDRIDSETMEEPTSKSKNYLPIVLLALAGIFVFALAGNSFRKKIGHHRKHITPDL